MKLSIITINLNNATGLQKTIKSVLNQNFTNYEYLIIDGGSTDGSVELIKEHQEDLAYWQSQPDKGIYSALNQGIAHAHGEYLLFLHSGDYLLEKNSLSTFFSIVLEADIVYGDAIRLNSSTHQPELYAQPDKLTALFFYRYSLCHQSMFFKRELFQKFGSYRTDLKIVADWAFNLKLFLEKHSTWDHRNIPIVFYDQSGVSSTNLQLLNTERDLVLCELYADSELLALDRAFAFRQSIIGRIAIKLRLLNRW